eukprot:11709356-Ditylum_brightwellii.AAC.1
MLELLYDQCSVSCYYRNDAANDSSKNMQCLSLKPDQQCRAKEIQQRQLQCTSNLEMSAKPLNK